MKLGDVCEFLRGSLATNVRELCVGVKSPYKMLNFFPQIFQSDRNSIENNFGKRRDFFNMSF